MLRTLLGAAIVGAVLSTAALAGEPTPPAAGPLVLDDRQLEAISAGNTGHGGLVGAAFFQAHNSFAANAGGLPQPAQRLIILLHAPLVMRPPV